MKERGMIKWLPFDSVAPSKEMLRQIVLEKQKVSKPILSSEQLICIEKSLWEAFHTGSKVMLSYYLKGYIYQKEGFIDTIDKVQRRIFLNHTQIYFEQIIEVNIK